MCILGWNVEFFVDEEADLKLLSGLLVHECKVGLMEVKEKKRVSYLIVLG